MFKANGYDAKLFNKNRRGKGENGVQKKKRKQRKATFTYFGNEGRSITKIFLRI